MKLDPYLSFYTKINSKLLNDLNVRAKTTKLRRKHMGTRATKAKISKWDSLKLKIFWIEKEKKMKK